MTQEEIFGKGIWIGNGDDNTFPIIRDVFEYFEGETAEINILGFASFVLFINGERVHDEWFLPLNSEFEPRNQPEGEVLGHRAYVEKFDITKFLKPGRNVIAVMLGNGWYNERLYTYMSSRYPYGRKKVCWKISFSRGAFTREAVSSPNAVWVPSYVTENLLATGEAHRYDGFDFTVFTDLDYSGASPVIAEKAPETEYLFTDCPRDRVAETVKPRLIGTNASRIYDIGRNTSAVPVIKGCGKVTVRVGEALKDGKLDPDYIHGQHFDMDFGSEIRTASMLFTWLAFRYIEIEGDGEIEEVKIIYADVPVNSSFTCNNETLNWLYKAYINTQSSNMHYGMPSDCPQVERRGYTGDGQLACRAAMYAFDAKSFYGKWIEDIADGQDRLSGNIQYTAPYVPSGGGPGGWGCAIVQLPYQYWKFFGDDSKIIKHYDKMLRYFDYLEDNSEYDLITSAKAAPNRWGDDRWCLGDWCTPGPVELPAPFVNNYFYIKSLYQVLEIAEYLGKTDDIPILKSRIEARKKATTAAYFNTWDSRFFGARQGANAFALDIGLGNPTTEQKNTVHYEQLGCLDTGIFGTDVVIRHLFETNQGDLAVKLLCAESPRGVGEWKKRGLTTTPEYWVAGRSLSHPMFGAVVSNLFEYILGIRQAKDSSGFKNTIIAPSDTESITSAGGHITTPYGKISVEFETLDNKRSFTVEIPDGISAVFRFKDTEIGLKYGTNKISV